MGRTEKNSSACYLFFISNTSPTRTFVIDNKYRTHDFQTNRSPSLTAVSCVMYVRVSSVIYLQRFEFVGASNKRGPFLYFFVRALMIYSILGFSWIYLYVYFCLKFSTRISQSRSCASKAFEVFIFSRFSRSICLYKNRTRGYLKTHTYLLRFHRL